MSGDIRCPRCFSRKVVERGVRRGKRGVVRVYKCAICGRYFSDTTSYDALLTKKDILRKIFELRDDGYSLRRIRDFIWKKYGVKVSHVTVRNWIEKFDDWKERALRRIERASYGDKHYEFFANGLVEVLLNNRDYHVLAWTLVRPDHEVAEALAKCGRESYYFYKGVVRYVKRKIFEKIWNSPLKSCPRCCSWRVSRRKNVYVCVECKRTFRDSTTHERDKAKELLKLVVHYYRSEGMKAEDIRDYLEHVYGVKVSYSTILKWLREDPPLYEYEDVRREALALAEYLLWWIYDNPIVKERAKEDFERIEEEKRRREEEKKKILETLLGGDVKLSEEEERVLMALKTSEGVSLSEIARRTGLSLNRVKTAVKWLERFGLVRVERFGRSVAVFRVQERVGCPS